mmetsp:Transcript_28911/g.55158  ORF Transcript_28911/g.55158 Transcript_28911/m.55158 type:complete len:202 (+) Transcript_28911:2939-3544(+)
MLGSFDRVAADANGRGLANAQIGGLFDRLIGQRAGTGYNPARPALVDVTGHDADFAGIGRDHAGAVGANKARFGAFQSALNLHHVEDRDAFGDADDQGHLGVNGLKDAVCRKGGRDIDDGSVCLSPGHRLVNAVIDGQVKVGHAAFAGGHATDHLGAVSNRLLGVECTLGPCEALADDFGIFVDEDGHVTSPSCVVRWPRA